MFAQHPQRPGSRQGLHGAWTEEKAQHFGIGQGLSAIGKKTLTKPAEACAPGWRGGPGAGAAG